MEQKELTKKHFPPRPIEAISAGVNIISQHIYLVFFPILLDVFFWLGPKFSLKPLFENNVNQFFTTISPFYENSNIELLSLMKTTVFNFLDSFNLFTVASTFPVGIPSLVTKQSFMVNPLGVIKLIDVQSFMQLFFSTGGLLFAGVLIGSFYFKGIANANSTSETLAFKEKPFGSTFLNILLFSIILIAVFFSGVFLLLVISSLVSILSPLIGQFLFLSGLAMLGWLLTPAIFAPVSILAFGQNAIRAIISAYQIMGLNFRYQISTKEVIYTLPKSIIFTLWALVLYQGLNLLWAIPETSSWIFLIGIIGHGLVTTILLIAGFQYYIRMYEWQDSIKLELQSLATMKQ